jgi:hypothetical protein
METLATPFALTTAAVLAAMFSLNAVAVEYDIGVGYTQTDEPGNGNWWQREFDHELKTSSPSVRVGVKFRPVEAWPRLKLLAGFKYLARVESYALASASDENYAEFQAGREEIWPLSTWRGKGSVRGAYVTAEYNFDNFFITGGWWLHRVKWRVEIPDWLYQEDSAPRSLTVTDNTEKVGVLLGFGKYFGDWRVAYELAEINGGSDFKPMMVGGSHNLEISYTF